MRRCKKPRTNAGGAESGFDHRASRAFSVGAGDVDGAKTVLRIVQRGKNRPDPIEAEFGGFNFIAQCVEEAHGVGIGHLFLRYRSQPEAMAAKVPRASFPSKSATFLTSGGGMMEQAMARKVTAVPDRALNHFLAFQALAKTYK